MKRIVLFLLVGLGGFVIAEQFVTPKKKRISTTTLKETIGHRQGDIISLNNRFISFSAMIQKFFITKTTQLLEQEANSFFAKANAVQLQEYDSAVANLVDVLDDCERKIKEAYAQVQAHIK